jgi:hypothetical protein
MGEETYAAALGAYGLAAEDEEVSPLLDGRQGMVIELARRLAQSASL